MSYEILKVSGSLVEHWKYQHAPIVVKRSKYANTSRKGYRKSHARRADNIRRSRALFTRIVRSNLLATEIPALVTLTMLEVLPVKTSFRLLTQFFTRCRKQFGRDFKYIAAIEFQQRGATHFHILWWGLPNNLPCRGSFKQRGKRKVFYCSTWKEGQCECEKRTIQRLWSRGYADCIATDGSNKLAGYLAKYMSKSMQDIRLGGERAYCASRNVLRPMRAASRAFGDEILDQIGASGTPRYIHKFNVRFLGECTYQAYEKDPLQPKVPNVPAEQGTLSGDHQSLDKNEEF